MTAYDEPDLDQLAREQTSQEVDDDQVRVDHTALDRYWEESCATEAAAKRLRTDGDEVIEIATCLLWTQFLEQVPSSAGLLPLLPLPVQRHVLRYLPLED